MRMNSPTLTTLLAARVSGLFELVAWLALPEASAGEPTKRVLVLSGANSGIVKEEFVLVSSQAQLDELWKSLKKSAGGAESELLNVLVLASCDFDRYEVILMLTGE